MNRLCYLHTTLQGVKGHDSFRFFLSDAENQSPSQSFFISLRAVHKGDIVLVTRPVTLMAGERVIFTTDILLATDSGGRAEELVYTVSIPPSHGHLHAVQHPGMPLHTFSQLDVAAQRVCYTHDNSRFAQHDSVSFVVSNGVTSKSGSLLFKVEHGDRIPPTLSSNNGLRLTEGATVPISQDILELTDPDTAANNLTYTVAQLPQYGRLLLRGQPLSQRRFTQADINSLDLTYQHQSGPARIDRFTFLASDGTNRGFLLYGQLREEPVTFTIEVEHVDKTPPSLVTRRTPSTVENLEGGKQGIYITSRDLQASDPDSPDQELEFTILRSPHFGHLENALTGGYIKGRFTQKDLDQRGVRYIIDLDVDVTGDSFEFHVTDPAGNTMLSEVLELKWSRVELSATCFRVCENVGTLPVQVMRSGNSIDPAYIGIQVVEGTAKVGRDFTHSTAALIQFDPGVNVKSWNIYLKDDGLEENHEKFEVVLKGQKNTVLGQRQRATVEIVDPRGGNCDPEELRLEEEAAPVLPPPRVHPPPLHTPSQAQEVRTPHLQPEGPWERPPHPPRGDVPNRHPFLDYSEGELRDQAGPGPRRTQLRVLGSSGGRAHFSGVEMRGEETSWMFHGIIPLRAEDKRPPNPAPVPQVHTDLQVTPIWTWSGPAHPEEAAGDTPQGDSPQTAPHKRKAVKVAGGACPPGWVPHKENCYMLSSDTASWSSAQQSCALLFDSHLTSVDSKTDMKWLWKFAGKQPFWIGLTATSGQWSWTDGHPLSFSKLKKASVPEPQPQDESEPSCVLVQNQRRWTPMSCTSEEHRYICSTPAHFI
ncbi:hypothetical protein AAFF_G00032290 [Aldrovandia affinis]|uniref:C-type lectin domain-containing protein n=1 Tax=Aldrovandia affinis TaxID=143900 RepID=A0AAD7S3X9_9TELE|nr:hypothetical protein AAFF_G00032290 [Aldrovandia affinis]